MKRLLNNRCDLTGAILNFWRVVQSKKKQKVLKYILFAQVWHGLVFKL